MSKLESVRAEMSMLQGLLKDLKKQETTELKKTLVGCRVNRAYRGKACGAKIPIGELTYLQTHWYTEPHGCTGGDYWSQGEGQFICPECGYMNRLYDRKEFQELKHYFKDVKDTYDDL